MSSSDPIGTEDGLSSAFGSQEQDEPMTFEQEDEISDMKTEDVEDQEPGVTACHSPTPDSNSGNTSSKSSLLLCPDSKGYFVIRSLDDLQQR